MKQILVISLMAFSGFHESSARLRETEPEIEARYGTPIAKLRDVAGDEKYKDFGYRDGGEGGNVYTYKDFYVRVILINGKSQYECYIRKDPTRLLSAGDIQELLKLNSSGAWGWNPQKRPGVWFSLERSDVTSKNLKLKAWAGTFGPRGRARGLIVCTPEFLPSRNKYL